MPDTIKQLFAEMREQDPTPVVRVITRMGAAGLMALFALLLYAPALGDSLFVYGTDTTSHDYIMHFYAWVTSIGGRGELPLWNPYMFSGMPMIASAAICPFYPTQWLYAILPFNTAFTLQYVFALLIGGIGAGWWMRCLGLRRSICIWAGFITMVSGHFLTLTYAGHLQKMIALGWAPVALGATIQLVRLGRGGVRHSYRYKAAALLGIALAMQLLASHPQVFYATADACILQLIGMALAAVPWKKLFAAEKAKSVSPGKAFRPLGRAVVMSLLALAVCVAISAVQLFPSLEMAGLSNRADGVSFAEATATSYPPLELLEYAVPQIFGDSVRGSIMPYFGDWGERIVSDYIGLPVLLLAMMGLFGSRRRYRWFLLTLFVAGILVGLGRYTPLYWILYYTLPGFDGFRSPGTFMFLANFGLIGLSALGMDYLVCLAERVNDKGWDSSFSENDATDESPVAETDSTAPRHYTADETQPFEMDSVYSGTDTPPQNPSIDYDELEGDSGFDYDYAAANANISSSNFTWDNDNIPWLGRPVMLVFLAAMAVTALIAAIIALAENWDMNLQIATPEELLRYHTYSRVADAAIAVMCILSAILLLRFRTWIGALTLGVVAVAFPLAHNYHFLKFEPLTPFMAHLTGQPALKHLAENGSQPIRLAEGNALKNEDMLYHISSVAGYHPIVPMNYAIMGGSLRYTSDAFAELFAVNHARTMSEEEPVAGTWIADEKNVGVNGGWLWHRAVPAPYVRDRANVVAVDTDEISLTSATLQRLESSQDIAGRIHGPVEYAAYISERDMRRYGLTEGPQQAEARLEMWLPHEVRMRVRASPKKEHGGAVMPVSDPYFPGWHAETSEGRPLPVINVNGVQRAVILPEGENHIRFVFSPFSFRLGLFISLISATLLVSFGIGTLVRRFEKGRKRMRKAIRRAQTGQQTTLNVNAEKGALE